jgi:hypothetical protein
LTKDEQYEKRKAKRECEDMRDNTRNWIAGYRSYRNCSRYPNCPKNGLISVYHAEKEEDDWEDDASTPRE